MGLDESLKLTAGWGYFQKTAVMPGAGQVVGRPWSQTERDRLLTLAELVSLTLDQVLGIFGDTCVDVYLNGTSFWSSVPINVWEYTLSGYQVIKKWLSYREHAVLGRPLHPEEAEYFSDVVRRIAGILLLGPALNDSYANIVPTGVGLPSH